MAEARLWVLIKTLLFTMVAPGTVTVLIPYLLLEPDAKLNMAGGRLLGILPIGLGALTYCSCAWRFAFEGFGTPAPIDPPKVLVAKGLYRLVRNPMYVGVGLVLLGESIFFASPRLLVYALCAGLISHLFVVFCEEPTLKKKFGAQYSEYCRAVPRWIPRWRLQR